MSVRCYRFDESLEKRLMLTVVDGQSRWRWAVRLRASELVILQ